MRNWRLTTFDFPVIICASEWLNSGYMAPEYAMEGIFSIKSDVYSFGVLLVEIVTGVRRSSIDDIMGFPNLIIYVSTFSEVLTQDQS